MISQLFKTMSIDAKLDCIFTNEGVLFILNDRVAQMNCYFNAESCLEYQLQVEELRLTLNLARLKQCLVLLNSDFSTTGPQCEWIHYKNSGQLQIKLVDHPVTIRSDLALYDYEESVNLDQEFLSHNVVAKAIIPVSRRVNI